MLMVASLQRLHDCPDCHTLREHERGSGAPQVMHPDETNVGIAAEHAEHAVQALGSIARPGAVVNTNPSG